MCVWVCLLAVGIRYLLLGKRVQWTQVESALAPLCTYIKSEIKGSLRLLFGRESNDESRVLVCIYERCNTIHVVRVLSLDVTTLFCSDAFGRKYLCTFLNNFEFFQNAENYLNFCISAEMQNVQHNVTSSVSPISLGRAINACTEVNGKFNNNAENFLCWRNVQKQLSEYWTIFTGHKLFVYLFDSIQYQHFIIKNWTHIGKWQPYHCHTAITKMVFVFVFWIQKIWCCAVDMFEWPMRIKSINWNGKQMARQLLWNDLLALDHFPFNWKVMQRPRLFQFEFFYFRTSESSRWIDK